MLAETLHVRSTAFILTRERFLRASLAAVGADREDYDAAWARITEEPSNTAALHRLHALVGMMARETISPARQCNRMRRNRVAARKVAQAGGVAPAGAVAGCLAWLLGRATAGAEEEEGADYRCTVPSLVDEQSPVVSLDQLYVQASSSSFRPKSNRNPAIPSRTG